MPETEIPADPVAAALAAIKERSERSLGLGVGALPISNDAVRCLMASAGDVPRLLAAVEAVLEEHRHQGQYLEYAPCAVHLNPTSNTREELDAAMTACPRCDITAVAYCGSCRMPWPCDEYRAIFHALLGEEGEQ